MKMKAQFDRKPGSVFVKVNPPKAGHVANARRQDWKLIAHEMIAEVQRPTTPPVEKQIPEPVSTPEPPKQSLAELLIEVDAIMYPVRVNTEPARGNHYSDHSGTPKANRDSALIAY